MSDDTKANMQERVLSAIEERGACPKPGWHFLLREGVVWGVAILALVVGSVATALTVYIAQASFLTERRIAMSEISTLFSMLPYVWLALVLLGLFYVVHAIHMSQRGYKVGTRWVVLGALGASIVLGFGLHIAGTSEVIDRYFITHAPFYKPLSGFRASHWMDVEHGQWVGVVVERHPPFYTLHTIDGLHWTVLVTESTTVHGPHGIETGMRVRVVGTTTEPHMCEAYEIRPFQGRGGPNMKPMFRQ